MFYYPILTTKKLPVMFYYSSQFEMVIGQLVIVNLQNQLLEGIVFGPNKTAEEMICELKLELEKVKNIEKTQPLVLQNDQIQFLRFLINNTFNNSGTIIASFLQPLKILNQKHWQTLYFNLSKNLVIQKNSKKETLENSVSKNIISNLSKNKPSQNWDKNLETNNKIIDQDDSQDNGKTQNLKNFKIETLTLKIELKHHLKGEKSEISFWLEEDYTLRIIYIIRNRQIEYQKLLNKFLQKKLENSNQKTANESNQVKNQIKNSSQKSENWETKNLEIVNKQNLENLKKNNLYNSTLENKKIVFDIVIIFPENKLLDKVWKDFINSPSWQKFLEKITVLNWTLENYFWTSKINQKSRKTILELLNLETENKKTEKYVPSKLDKTLNLQKVIVNNILKDDEIPDKKIQNANLENYKIRLFWGTRSALFLPFENLVQIILIDEANSFHIQEQNSLYFDSREAVFLLHKSANCHLDFVSKLPSVRFQTFYQQNNKLAKNLPKINNQKLENSQNFKLKITTSPQKYYNNNLFSNQVEQILQREETFGYFGEEESLEN